MDYKGADVSGQVDLTELGASWNAIRLRGGESPEDALWVGDINGADHILVYTKASNIPSRVQYVQRVSKR